MAISAPAVFNFTSVMNPERHLQMAKVFGASIQNSKLEDAGKILSDQLRSYLMKLGVPNGLAHFGYSSSDVPKLVEGTLPQKRVLNLSPLKVEGEILADLFSQSMKMY